MDIFITIKEAVDVIVGSSYELIPALENISILFAFMISLSFFWAVFIIPVKLLQILFSKDDPFKQNKKRKYF